MNKELMGILHELVEQQWVNPDTGKPLQLPIDAICMEESLEGREGTLIRDLHGDANYCVVCDQVTKDILAQRVQRSLGAGSDLLVLETPKTTAGHVTRLREQTKDHDVLVAVGSGSVSDLVKYATFLDGKEYCVFPTSPMNAYSTGTASITIEGRKQSIKAHSARGIFFDMDILANCPPRLVNNALADVVCRTTAQVDWRLSRAMWETPYSDLPYILLAHDEKNLFANARLLHDGDMATLASLVRTCVLNGLGTIFTGTTHAGSMAEHMISHYLDDVAGDRHPGSLHGEQVGITTLTVLRLHNAILNAPHPPVLAATRHTEDSLRENYGDNAAAFAHNLSTKRFAARDADYWNQKLADGWDEFAAPLREVMLPLATVEKTMLDAGCATRPEDLGFTAPFYAEAVAGARFLRDRFTILDLADDAGLLPRNTS